jgi:hypothetical protein
VRDDLVPVSAIVAGTVVAVVVTAASLVVLTLVAATGAYVLLDAVLS